MKVAIFCGGLGTRLSEETQTRPKPMVEIGGRPILWHIMRIYHHFAHRDFTLALGYKGEVIKDYFLNYRSQHCDIDVHLKTGAVQFSNPVVEDWSVSMVDTGTRTETGGRLRRLRDHLAPHGTFMLTYGDGVSNVDLNALLDFHKSHGRLATVTAVRPPARFGDLNIVDGQVTHFEEKPQSGEGWINGGFFVLEPKVFDYIVDDSTIFERAPLEQLARDGQLMSYKHFGYWQSMDTLRDKLALEALWSAGGAPWANWNSHGI